MLPCVLSDKENTAANRMRAISSKAVITFETELELSLGIERI